MITCRSCNFKLCTCSIQGLYLSCAKNAKIYSIQIPEKNTILAFKIGKTSNVQYIMRLTVALYYTHQCSTTDKSQEMLFWYNQELQNKPHIFKVRASRKDFIAS